MAMGCSRPDSVTGSVVEKYEVSGLPWIESPLSNRRTESSPFSSRIPSTTVFARLRPSSSPAG